MFETVVQICQHFTKIGNAWKKTDCKTVQCCVSLCSSLYWLWFSTPIPSSIWINCHIFTAWI